MKEKKHYISIKFKGGNTYHQNGKCLKLTDKIINVGETPDCDIRYDSNGLQPEYYASIIQNEDGKSWRIIKRSQHIEISIDGKGEIGYAHQLVDGDLIHFSDQQLGLCFHTHYDNRYDKEKQHNVWQWTVTGLVGLLTLVTIVFYIGNSQDIICVNDMESLEESIYYLEVDSLRRILTINGEEIPIPPTKVLEGEAPTGTAFLTTDGRLITARHCVEYWIGTDFSLTTQVSDLNKDDVIRWGIETETFNQLQEGDSLKHIQVFFSVYDFLGNKKLSSNSTDKHIHMNKDKDGVFLLADFSQNYYWRTIRPYYTDRQMELGDILWVDSFPEHGKITIANEKQLEKIKNGTKLMICGYPMTGVGDKRMTSTEGVIRRNASIEGENLFYEANINHGFSGGPILTKIGNDIVAIGVVSRVDSVSSGLYKWGVPVSEMKKTNEK